MFRSFTNSSLLALLIAAGIASQATAAIPASERNALIAIYNATNGPGWVDSTGWLGAPGTECTWRGVTCDATQSTVTDFHSYRNGMSGTLPPEIRELKGLIFLTLFGETLNGPIPAALAELDSVAGLTLVDCGLTGSIPPELGNLPRLNYLELGGNELSGDIPRELLQLPLSGLDLSENKFSGPFPELVLDFPYLTELSLGRNAFTGAIPPGISRLTQLRSLYLGSCGLSGPIPPELGSLSELEVLDLSGNQLSGAIPSELGALHKLRRLHLRHNELTGALPPELGSTALMLLDVSANLLTGGIPPEFGQLPLEFIYADSCQLDGTIPPELGSATALRQIHLGRNHLTGPIPSELGNLKALQAMQLSDNRLTGPLPPELSTLPNLTTIDLSRNEISGSIPPEFGQFPVLRYLNLGDNELDGEIPPELGNVASLERLDLSYNRLGGTIPSTLANLTALTWLALDRNKLRGPLPPSLAALTNLNRLDLKFNALWADDPLVDEWAMWRDYTWQVPWMQSRPPESEYMEIRPTSTGVQLFLWGPYEIDRYEVWVDRGSGFELGATSQYGTAPVTVTGLAPGTRYRFIVRTLKDPWEFNKNLVVSDFSAPVEAITWIDASVGSVTIEEGPAPRGTFTITLSAPTVETITAGVTFSGGTVARADYIPPAGATFAPGETTKTIELTIVDDALDEWDETAEISCYGHGIWGKNPGLLTIIDNDAPPNVSIGDTGVVEGTVGVTDALFPLTLDAPSGKSISVDWMTADGTAEAGSDYFAARGTAVIPPGQTTTSVLVQVLGDPQIDERELFFVNLTSATNAGIFAGEGECVITDDDFQRKPPDPVIQVTGCSEVGSPCELTARSGTQWDQSDWSYVWSLDGVVSSTAQRWSPPLLEAGTYNVTLVATNGLGSGQSAATLLLVKSTGACPEDQLCMLSKRFRATLTARDQRSGRSAPGVPIPQNDLFGYFALPALTGNEGNPEVFVKIIDGRTVNDAFWVFYGGLTDLEYLLTITDSITGEIREYAKAAGSTAGGFDTGNGVIPESCAGEVDGAAMPATVPVPCNGGTDGLCLANGQFLVQLAARDQRTERSGAGLAMPQGELFGYFSIPDLTNNGANPEVFVKIVDGRVVNGSFWIFFSGLTDMEYTITVTNTLTGERKAYTKAAGSACGAYDTNAF